MADSSQETCVEAATAAPASNIDRNKMSFSEWKKYQTALSAPVPPPPPPPQKPTKGKTFAEGVFKKAPVKYNYDAQQNNFQAMPMFFGLPQMPGFYGPPQIQGPLHIQGNWPSAPMQCNYGPSPQMQGNYGLSPMQGSSYGCNNYRQPPICNSTPQHQDFQTDNFSVSNDTWPQCPTNTNDSKPRPLMQYPIPKPPLPSLEMMSMLGIESKNNRKNRPQKRPHRNQVQNRYTNNNSNGHQDSGSEQDDKQGPRNTYNAATVYARPQGKKEFVKKPPRPPQIIANTPEEREKKTAVWREYRQGMKPFKNRDFFNAKRTVQRLSKIPASEMTEKDQERLATARETMNTYKQTLQEKCAQWELQQILKAAEENAEGSNSDDQANAGNGAGQQKPGPSYNNQPVAVAYNNESSANVYNPMPNIVIYSNNKTAGYQNPSAIPAYQQQSTAAVHNNYASNQLLQNIGWGPDRTLEENRNKPVTFVSSGVLNV